MNTGWNDFLDRKLVQNYPSTDSSESTSLVLSEPVDTPSPINTVDSLLVEFLENIPQKKTGTKAKEKL